MVGFPLPPLFKWHEEVLISHFKELNILKNDFKGNQNITKIIQHLKGQSIVMKHSLKKQKSSILMLEDGARLNNQNENQSNFCWCLITNDLMLKGLLLSDINFLNKVNYQSYLIKVVLNCLNKHEY